MTQPRSTSKALTRRSPGHLVVEGDLNRYLQEIRKYPILTQEQEYNYAKKWTEEGDVEAAHYLVTSHLRLVAKIAMGYRGYGLPVSDLISEGNVGLMQAVKRFDPEKGFRMATYAMWWIKASIQEYILHSWSLVKMGTTAAQKKLFFNLRKLKNQMKAVEQGDLTPEQVEEIARELNVAEHEVVNMNRRLSGPDHSLNAPVRHDQDGDSEWIDWLVTHEENQEDQITQNDDMSKRRELLADAMGALNEREQIIFAERRLSENPQTLEELSKRFEVSRERVRQIENRAFEKVQQAMMTLARESGYIEGEAEEA